MYIYTLNNNTSNNGVVVMDVLSEGRPYPVIGSPFATGGLGSGLLHEEQGAVRIHGGAQQPSELRKGYVRTYAVQQNGTLVQGPGSPLNTQQLFNGNGPQLGGNIGFSWSPSGSHLLVTGFGGSTVTVIPVNGTTAAQSPPLASVPNGQSYACWTALSPDGNSLYVTNPGNSTVYGVATGGSLTLRGSSPRCADAPVTTPAPTTPMPQPDLTSIQVAQQPVPLCAAPECAANRGLRFGEWNPPRIWPPNRAGIGIDAERHHRPSDQQRRPVRAPRQSGRRSRGARRWLRLAIGDCGGT